MKMKLIIPAICFLAIGELLDAAFGPQSVYEIVFPAISLILALIAVFQKN